MTEQSRQREEWTPDWAIHPGSVLEDHLEVRGWSQAEFARRAGLTRKLVSTIIAAKNPVSPESAIAFERVLGLKAAIWTGIQNRWDLHVARTAEAQTADDWSAWLERFPIKDLKARGILPPVTDKAQLLDALLRFLGVGSPRAYADRLAGFGVQYRHSPKLESSRDGLFVWLQLGLRKAETLDLEPFDAERFREAAQRIRALTVEAPEDFLPRMKHLCAEAGVALVLEKPLPKTCLSGAAFWTDTGHPVIMLSLRHKTNDHFWFSFFHEAAHILLHARNVSFVDDKDGTDGALEREANLWAEDILVGRDRFDAFAQEYPWSEKAVTAFAREIGVHPGIVVGMLQHRRILAWSHLNGLKTKLDWVR